jgi:hypothetical protein
MTASDSSLLHFPKEKEGALLRRQDPGEQQHKMAESPAIHTTNWKTPTGQNKPLGTCQSHPVEGLS